MQEELTINRYAPSVLECRSCKRRCLAELKNYHESICDGGLESSGGKVGKEEEGGAPSDDADEPVIHYEVDIEKLEICPVCQRKYSRVIFEKHKASCLKRYNFRVSTQKKNETPLEGCSPPGPPTDFSVGGATHSSVTMRWVCHTCAALVLLPARY